MATESRHTGFFNPAPSTRTILLKQETAHRLVGGVYDKTYGYYETATGQRFVYPGLWLGRNSDTNKFVPYNENASYGPGSDTLVGILDERLDVTYWDAPVTPVYSGEVHRRFVYVWGSTLESTPTDLATDLPGIHLKPEVTS